MKQMKKKSKGLFAALALTILLGSIFRVNAAMTVRAETASIAELERAFSIQAELLPSDKETYSVRLTVENQGPDWEGTARLTANENYRIPCAYDTALSLPQGSRKQFVVKVPLNSIDNTNGTVNVTLLDRRGMVEATQEFKRLLSGQAEALSLGILSDAYSKLTYMDLGGEEIYFYNDTYPIKLVQLQQGSLEEELESLTFLVIDQYNTGILTQEELAAIEQWNLDGGVLILGTGAYAEDTLRGFADGYLGLSCREIHTPEEGYALYSGPGSFAGLSQLTLAELEGTADKFNSLYRGCWFDSVGVGSLCVTAYSLAELADLEDTYWATNREDFVMQLLDNTVAYASLRYSSYSAYYDNSSSYIRRLLGIVGNSNSILNFGVLKWIVILYVIFVGPILYLILRLAKRRELYWLAVPATALLGIGLVFLAGRGFEVVSTKVYSVTVKNLSGGGNGITYLYCYDADRGEWSLRLEEGCEYAGPLINTSYYGSSDSDAYYYHIRREGDTFFMGVKPDSNFEDSYFYMSSTGNDSGTEGSLLMQNMAVSWDGVSGTVTNDTNKNIEYLAVLWNDSMYIFEGIPAGASCRLQEMPLLYDSSSFYYGSFIYDFMQDYYYDKDYGKTSTLAALGVGIYDALARVYDNEFVVIGVVEKWDKTVDDTCSEISYGCLYAVQ